ncbi:MAG: sensor domain-containing protein [Proteobacteria bacterium]|nr:sensor domain-containing protein [Pseudomonadota bacterium]
MNANATPRSIAEYLDQLRAALKGADPAMIQDALYDAEEHLRSELAENPQTGEAELLEKICGSYGAPEEVAEIYRNQEKVVTRALRPPPPRPRSTAWGRFFGVAADPHTWGALFYLVLSLATGIFYFTWAMVGLSMSAGFAVLIIGAPFFLLFMASVRGLSLLEGRIVETMLGVRMPRRPPYTERERPLLQRIGAMLTDPRTWSTLVYMLLMLPLGIFYFMLVTVWLAVSLALIAAPFAQMIWHLPLVQTDNIMYYVPSWAWPVEWALGIFGLFVLLHLVRKLGRMHGGIAKHLLVKMASA